MLTQPGTEHEPGKCMMRQSLASDHVLIVFAVLSLSFKAQHPGKVWSTILQEA